MYFFFVAVLVQLSYDGFTCAAREARLGVEGGGPQPLRPHLTPSSQLLAAVAAVATCSAANCSRNAIIVASLSAIVASLAAIVSSRNLISRIVGSTALNVSFASFAFRLAVSCLRDATDLDRS